MLECDDEGSVVLGFFVLFHKEVKVWLVFLFGEEVAIFSKC